MNTRVQPLEDLAFPHLAASLWRLLPVTLLILFCLWFFQPLEQLWMPLFLTGALGAWLITGSFSGSSGGRPLGYYDAPDLVRRVQVLSERAGLSRVPRLVFLPGSLINAAASLEGGGTVYVTEGLLRHLGGRELSAVLAHEISHLRHGDLWITRLMESVLLGLQTVALGAWWFLPYTPAGSLVVLVFSTLLPPVIRIFHRSFLREREYAADAGAASLTGDPEALASALATIEYRQGRPWWWPLPEARTDRTHPDSSLRIRKLLSYRELARKDLLWRYS